MSQTVEIGRFSEKSAVERVWLTFDFSDLTASPSGPVITVTRYAGANDAAPSSILSGAPVVNGAKVMQLVVDGVEGSDYLLMCQADAPDGSRFVVPGVLPVRAKV